MVTGKSDHFIVLGDGRADHMGKGVTDIRSSQRQLAPDIVGPDTAEPTFLRALSTKASAAKAHRFKNLYGCQNPPSPPESVESMQQVNIGSAFW